MEKYVAKKDNLMLFKAFSINLNAQHVNGMTHFDLTLHCGKLNTLDSVRSLG